MEKAIQENYTSNLKAVEYYKLMTNNLQKIPDTCEFFLSFLHEVFNSGRYKGKKLLEIGSGPIVYNIASASAYFSNIVQSDYVPDNCEELRRWHNKQSSLDWSKFFDLINQLEGHTEDKLKAREELESRIRKSVKSVVQCDILKDLEFQLKSLVSKDVRPPYDAVLTLACVEASCPDFVSYVDCLKKINGILRPGGTFLICGYTNNHVWYTDDKSFHHLKLSLQEILNAMQMANFRILYLKAYSRFEDYMSDYEILYCMACEKIA